MPLLVGWPLHPRENVPVMALRMSQSMKLLSRAWVILQCLDHVTTWQFQGLKNVSIEGNKSVAVHAVCTGSISWCHAANKKGPYGHGLNIVGRRKHFPSHARINGEFLTRRAFLTSNLFESSSRSVDLLPFEWFSHVPMWYSDYP